MSDESNFVRHLSQSSSVRPERGVVATSPRYYAICYLYRALQ
nr:MAG TPA: hypothetical protein [Caudoviricetes sp.]